MDLTKEQQDFFKHFTSNMRTHLLEFAKFLTSYKSDVYLVMSRKATSLISAMIDLGILHLHGQMVSDKILDMKLDWLRDKKVTIIDDVIISGTTINRTIGKLETIPVEQVKVAVIAVNQKWFEPDLFTIEHTRNSYLLDTYISLNDSECIQFCANVVASFLTLPRPYDLDFPYYKNQKITEKSLYKILSNNSFEAINITTISQKKTGVYSYSLFPSEETISRHVFLRNK